MLPCGAGKTIIGVGIISKTGQPSFILVHTKDLLEQWTEAIRSILGVEPGVVAEGVFEPRRVTVGMVQSLVKCAEEVVPHVGHLIVDECHRTPSKTFTAAVTAFDSRYMLGLSATPWRRDRLSRLIFWYLGDVVHEVDRDALVETGDVLRAEVIIRETNFRTDLDPSEEYSRVLSKLTQDAERNALIVQDVAHEARNGSGTCLVLSDRKAHLEAFRALLDAEGVNSEVLTGDLGKTERERVVAELRAGEVKVLLATGQLVGEGFDCPDITTLFLATPIRFDGRLLQYLGRVLRPTPGKTKAVVYDYHDVNVGVLVASARARGWTLRMAA